MCIHEDQLNKVFSIVWIFCLCFFKGFFMIIKQPLIIVQTCAWAFCVCVSFRPINLSVGGFKALSEIDWDCNDISLSFSSLLSNTNFHTHLLVSFYPFLLSREPAAQCFYLCSSFCNGLITKLKIEIVFLSLLAEKLKLALDSTNKHYCTVLCLVTQGFCTEQVIYNTIILKASLKRL